MGHSIEPFINRNPVILHDTASALQAAMAMTANRIGSVIVLNSLGEVSGLVTAQDIIRRVLARGKAMKVRLREFMTQPIVCAPATASVEEVLALMKENDVRHIPVLGKLKHNRHRCAGVVTLDDLVVARKVDGKGLHETVKSQILRRHEPGSTIAGLSPDPWKEEFLKQLAKSLRISEGRADSFARFAFMMLARRLHYTGSVQFILQLPYGFQAELFASPPGPETKITGEEIRIGTSRRLDLDEAAAQGALRELWRLTMNFGDRAKLQHAYSQLPPDIRHLLSEPPPGAQNDVEEWEGV